MNQRPQFTAAVNQIAPQTSLSADAPSFAPRTQENHVSSCHTFSSVQPETNIVLTTAIVTIVVPNGNHVNTRVLLDTGAEISLITERIAQTLKLSRTKTNQRLSRVSGVPVQFTNTKTKFKIRSHVCQEFKMELEALVVPQATNLIPRSPISKIDVDAVRKAGLEFADPYFRRQEHAGLVLSADSFLALLKPEIVLIPMTQLRTYNSSLGWILGGRIKCSTENTQNVETLNVSHCFIEEAVDVQIRRFWELEEVPEIEPAHSNEEEAAENLFKTTHVRTKDGRYVVNLPFREPVRCEHGNNYHATLTTLQSMVRRSDKNPDLKRKYHQFMQEYKTLGHMTAIEVSETDRPCWYLLHHAIIQSSGLSTKLRVVFDAARRNSSGHCLNDFLNPGPSLLRDLFLILLRWRNYQFVFTTDIIKMYRQILVREEDRDFQRVLWRSSPTEEPKSYVLNTVTYGTSCAPYLAMRCLKQLSKDEGPRFPMGAECVEEESYMDDFASGGDTIEEGVAKRHQLQEILSTAGFSLRKWS